jgi:hypothetical protein
LPIAIVRALHSALESGVNGEAPRPYLTADATTVERPNRLKPAGAVSTLAEMLANSAAGAALLAEQRDDVQHAVEVGDLAILRLTWTGVIARDLRPFTEGQRLTAHIAQFVTTRDGKVARIETYDCYEPFD